MPNIPAPGREPDVELLGVSKRYGDELAVDQLSLSIDAGAFVGLLGRNGAGKSTLIRMLTGLIRPTAGTIRILGLELEPNLLEVKKRIGVMPEKLALLDRLTGAQHLRFVGRMYGLEDDLIARRTEELFERLDLHPDGRTLLLDYSYGMRKKVAFCAAVMHAPQLVFLDEPFEGIDPLTSRTMKDMLVGLAGSGVTVILTSHVLGVVEELCERIVIVDHGHVVGDGSLDELRTELRRDGVDDVGLEALFVELMGGAREGSLSWL